MRRSRCGALLLGASIFLLPAIAVARPQYKDAFIAVYKVKPDSTLGKAQCGICHAGPDKKVRNAYGMELAKALGASNVQGQAIAAALAKIEKLPSADKKTAYVVLIKADKLPAGAPGPR